MEGCSNTPAPITPAAGSPARAAWRSQRPALGHLPAPLACEVRYADEQVRGVVEANHGDVLRIRLARRIVKVKHVTATLSAGAVSFNGEIRWRRGKVINLKILPTHRQS